MAFLNDDFFLTTPLARELFHEVAAKEPILDIHTHLPHQEVLEDRRFENLWDLWLREDHYKWRLMRGCGVDERFVSGDASPKEKFAAFASIMPLALENPVHHWAHLELKRVFEIDTVLSKETVDTIWNETEEQLQSRSDLGAQGLLKHFNVELVCTTDDAADSLDAHEAIAADETIPNRVHPTYRPDLAFKIGQPDIFNPWIEKLQSRVGGEITSYDDLISALKKRHDAFHEAGCRMSDHGPPRCPKPTNEKEAIAVFKRAQAGESISDADVEAFSYWILRHVAQWNSARGWTMQLHLGPLRNVNTRIFNQAGPDQGIDTMGAWPQTHALVDFLDSLNKDEILPRLIVYNLNPNESAAVCCALQNFQEGPIAGKLQYGPAWWHLDHAEGINQQISWLASLGALGTAFGMLTDSRSYTSFTRHEYYRRLLCKFLGERQQMGSIPGGLDELAPFLRNVCTRNARSYFAT